MVAYILMMTGHIDFDCMAIFVFSQFNFDFGINDQSVGTQFNLFHIMCVHRMQRSNISRRHTLNEHESTGAIRRKSNFNQCLINFCILSTRSRVASKSISRLAKYHFRININRVGRKEYFNNNNKIHFKDDFK